jgi:hypothetical protein
MTIPDLIASFPQLLLSWRDKKKDLVANVLANISADELQQVINLHKVQRLAEQQQRNWNNQVSDVPDNPTLNVPMFPTAPSNEEILLSQHQYLAALTNETLRIVECGMCGRETPKLEVCERRLASFDRTLLKPIIHHRDMVLFDGCLLHIPGIVCLGTRNDDLIIQVCKNCEKDIVRHRQPFYALSRGTWVGETPAELQGLTMAEELLIGLARTCVQVIKLYSKGQAHGDPSALQRGIRGTCSTYRQNIPEVVRMLEDKLLPLPSTIFSSTLSIAFIGKQKISRESIRSLFNVSRKRVYSSLLWLKRHNDLYADIEISGETLSQLPENDVPREILGLMRYSDDDSILTSEDTSYTDQADGDDSEGRARSETE